MNEGDIRAIVISALRAIAPEIDAATLRADRPLRRQVDLDSMDWLNFLLGLHDKLKVEIPESDYARLVTLGNHLSKLGNHLDRAVSTYNDVIGSIERSAFPAARRFEQLGATGGDVIPELVAVDHMARPLQAAEWRTDTGDNALNLNTLELSEGSGMPS